MEIKKFKKVNDGFICKNCNAKISPLKNGSCRNHCPECLYSLHVDNFPGDRNENCKGLMWPMAIEVKSRRAHIVVHQCTKCRAIRKNRLALNDPVQPDSFEVVLDIMKTYSYGGI